MSFWGRRSLRVPYIAQMEATECGAACLAMIASSHGRETSLLEARELCCVARDGTDARTILEAARGMGLFGRGVRCEIADLSRLPRPAILHWNLSHFVVLEDVRGGKFTVVDPAIGRKVVSFSRVAVSYTGVALVLRPTNSFVRRRMRRAGVRAQFGELAAVLPTAGLIGAITIMLEFLTLGLPASTQFLIDNVVRPSREEWVPWVLALMGLVVILHASLLAVRERLVQGISLLSDVRMLARFVDHLLSLPLPFFEQRSAAELAARIDVLVSARDVLLRLLAASFDGVLLVAFVTLIFSYDWVIGTFVLLTLLPRAGVPVLLTGKLRALSAEELVASGREASTMAEALHSPEATRAANIETRLLEQHARNVIQRINASFVRQRWSAAGAQTIAALDGLTFATALAAGTNAVTTERISVGALAAILSAVGLAVRPINNCVAAGAELAVLAEKLARVADVRDVAPERSGPFAPVGLIGRLELRSVAFRYARGGQMLLEDINICANPGETVALIGPSGCGKSTILKLLLGIASSTAGSVLIDGVDVHDWNLSCLRQRIGYVPQDVGLIDGTVRENVALGRAVTDEELDWALRIAGLGALMASLSDGLETRLGQGGHSVSGGQRQRIALARAVASRPSILLLDEATANLDPKLEQQVHADLRALPCTRVIVAHRLATVVDADRIYILNGGRIAQAGTFLELAKASEVTSEAPHVDANSRG